MSKTIDAIGNHITPSIVQAADIDVVYNYCRGICPFCGCINIRYLGKTGTCQACGAWCVEGRWYKNTECCHNE